MFNTQVCTTCEQSERLLALGLKEETADMFHLRVVGDSEDDFEKELPPYFLRIHKSYSVNMNMIRSINNNRIELFSGEVIPVAKAKYPEIKKSCSVRHRIYKGACKRHN